MAQFKVFAGWNVISESQEVEAGGRDYIPE
jgi:hypothetical protein